MIDLRGKTVLLTGGSRGIGRACALMMGKAGADMAISYLNNAKSADNVVADLIAEGRQAVALQGDFAKEETAELVFTQCREQPSPPSVVVINAGIWKRAPIDTITAEQLQETLDINLSSVFYLCRIAASQMIKKGNGNIILISSTAGQRGEAFHSHYAATKGAVIAMAKSLAAELGPHGVRTNVVAPGWVDTDMCTGILDVPEERQKIIDQIPLRRVASPEDIAGAVLFLASDLSRHINGEVINVNGGSVLCG
ncbi:MAG: SDR family oxidoreductase [Anaerolineales bacterium]|nr:SDR family oxidoreductase [Anaerolineales bacterium]